MSFFLEPILFLSFVKCSGHQMAGDSIHSLEGGRFFRFFFLKRRITIEVRVFLVVFAGGYTFGGALNRWYFFFREQYERSGLLDFFD